MASAGLPVQAAESYTMVDTGMRTTTAINAAGQVLGDAYYVYAPADGTLRNIHATTTPTTLEAGLDINALGQVAGYGPGVSTLIRNADGTPLGVGTLTGWSIGAATALNDAGQAVGAMSAPSAPGCVVHAFLGSIAAPQLIDLGTLFGGRTYAYDVNASGQVTGMSSIDPRYDCTIVGKFHAYIASAAGIRDLHAPTMVGLGSTGNKINNSGLVAGNYEFGPVTTGVSGFYPNGYPIRHAVVWDTVAGSYRDLGNGLEDSSLKSINANGDVVGFGRTFSTANFLTNLPNVLTQYAAIGSAASGGLANLNGRVTNLPAGWTLLSANDINDAGQIAADAKDAAGQPHGVLLTPVAASTAPAAPTGLSAAALSTSQIRLDWTDNASNETGMLVERCQGTGCTGYVQIAALGANVVTFTDSGLLAGTAYAYRVRAHGASSDSGWSNTVQVSTPPVVSATVPAAPGALSAAAVTRGQVVLTWTDNANNENSYLVERCSGSTCSSYVQIATLPANTTSYLDAGLRNNGSYRYRVRAANAIGKSAYSNVVGVRTLP